MTEKECDWPTSFCLPPFAARNVEKSGPNQVPWRAWEGVGVEGVGRAV